MVSKVGKFSNSSIIVKGGKAHKSRGRDDRPDTRVARDHLVSRVWAGMWINTLKVFATVTQGHEVSGADRLFQAVRLAFGSPSRGSVFLQLYQAC